MMVGMAARKDSVEVSTLKVPPGPVDLRAYDTGATPGFDGGKDEAEKALASLEDELADLQERLWAARTAGDRRRVLLVLQGMDTAGKGGVIRKALGLVDPQGLQITAFKKPTAEELEHDFLWRIRKAVPTPGHIGVFDRSHYEDVLIHRVRSLSPADEVERRYGAINDFEKELVDDGVIVLKCMLHVGAETQAERLMERLDNPDKHWKFNPADVDERALWSDYRKAYEVALERTNTEHAPWYVVPADRKWFRNLAVAELLRDTLADLGLGWPAAEFDVEAEKQRLRDQVVQ